MYSYQNKDKLVPVFWTRVSPKNFVVRFGLGKWVGYAEILRIETSKWRWPFKLILLKQIVLDKESKVLIGSDPRIEVTQNYQLVLVL